MPAGAPVGSGHLEGRPRDLQSGLPLAGIHRGPEASRCRTNNSRNAGLSTMSTTILTVDDSRTMRDMLMLALTDAGYRVVQAEDGVHGLEVLRNEMPQVVIT